MKLFRESYRKILLAQPKFFFNSCGSRGRDWSEGWIRDGLKWEPLFLAADPYRYFPQVDRELLGNIKMAYLGGYWPEKAVAFDQYLRPWEDILYAYGYQTWPYKHYQGQADELLERKVYSTVGLIPLLTGPAGWDLGEITERYFKAPACQAFCIADQNPAVQEIFTQDEILACENAEHFHEMVRALLTGKIDTESWRKKTWKAVMDRHLYKHRALQIAKALECVS
jgi:hypothetical protein